MKKTCMLLCLIYLVLSCNTKPPEPPVNTDSDGDGVNDSVDQCSNTPSGVSVNSQGCATSQLDSDGDGVNDNVDQCSNTPSGVSVNSQGCSTTQLIDSDDDGIIDIMDSCIYTFRGESVDAQGCSIYDNRDTDGDGIVNGLDLCKTTPRSSNVDEKGCSADENQDIDSDGVIFGADFCPRTPSDEEVNWRGCIKTVTNNKPNVYVLDAEGFYGNTHGIRIVATFNHVLSDPDDVNLHYYEYVGPTYSDVDILATINFLGYAEASSHNFTTIFFTSTDDSPQYSQATAIYWEMMDGRYFYKPAIRAAEYIRDEGTALMISSLENSSLIIQGDSLVAEYSDDFHPIPLSGALDDYIAFQQVGIEKTVFVGAYDSTLNRFSAAIQPDGVYNSNTIFVSPPPMTELPTVQHSTSHATPTLAAYAGEILRTDPSMTPQQLRGILFTLSEEKVGRQSRGADSLRTALYREFRGKVLTKVAVDNYVNNN